MKSLVVRLAKSWLSVSQVGASAPGGQTPRQPGLRENWPGAPMESLEGRGSLPGLKGHRFIKDQVHGFKCIVLTCPAKAAGSSSRISIDVQDLVRAVQRRVNLYYLGR